MRLVRVASFEPAIYIAPENRAAYDGRFATLLVDEASARRGGIGEVVRAISPRGEQFALKRLRLAEISGDQGAGGADALGAAFDAEYEAHRSLASLRGFPRLFGRGRIGDDPVIVMEWIEGVTLEAAARELAVDDAGRLSPLTAARIGRDLFDLLARMAYVEGGLVHRDVSLRNVMVNTARLSVADQVEEGAFELMLVDFGSATVRESGSPSLTARYGAVCGATADFAPPEMLTDDVPGVGDMRRSPAVDVYAAAGVLYALLEGHAPYDLSFAARSDRGGRSAFRIKTDFAPEPPAGAHGTAADLGAVLAREPEVAVAVGRAAAELGSAPAAHRVRLALAVVDGQLDGLLDACLVPQQARRPKAAAVRDALALFCSQYADNIARALRGEPLAPCPLGGTAPRLRRRRRLRRAARLAAAALSVATAAAAAISAGVLANGMPVAFPAAGPWWEGPLPGAAAVALLLPLACALLLRGRGGGTSLGLVLGVLGDLLGAMAAGLLIALVAWPGGGVREALHAALFLAAAAPLPMLTADRALADVASLGPAASARLRPVLPWGVPPMPEAAPAAGALSASAGAESVAAESAALESASASVEAVYELADETGKEPA